MRKSFGVLMCATALAAACGSPAPHENQLPAWDAPADRGGVPGATGTSGVEDEDGSITSEVKAALLGDDRIAPFKIEVRTDNGIVLLNGNLPTRSDAARAVMLAQRADGVRKVVDNLHVAR